MEKKRKAEEKREQKRMKKERAQERKDVVAGPSADEEE
jgi:hypothetical protein